MRKGDPDRANSLRVAGGPKPTLREWAIALALKRSEVRTADLTTAGILRRDLSRMCKEGLLVKVGYGRYRASVVKAD